MGFPLFLLSMEIKLLPSISFTVKSVYSHLNFFISSSGKIMLFRKYSIGIMRFILLTASTFTFSIKGKNMYL